ncbi:hypothetical protein D6777_04005 [Candidatus Woesearchaeota archaeon]|nr:MAG: hypothetical protein D6777_04005 [Candidatus Woesearchaeota archaeon]
MAFIRIKSIQNKHYAYLVKNIWSKRKKYSKQKVVSYLGPLTTLERVKTSSIDLDYSQYSSKTIYKKLLAQELLDHGFEKKRFAYEKDNIKVNFSHKAVTKNEKPVVLELNEGFLCTYTLTKLYNYRPKHLNPKEEGLRYANLLLQAGLRLNQQTFIELFNKVYNLKKDN